MNEFTVMDALRYGEPERVIWYEDQGLKWVRRAFTNTFNKSDIF